MATSCRGYSKAQMCFFKILHIISSTPPTKGVGIDLNLRFSSVVESQSSRSNNTSVTVQPNTNKEKGLPEKSADEVSDKVVDNNINQVININNHVQTDRESDGDGDAETAPFKGRDGNCFDLLIEAARVVSGKDEESDSEEDTGLGDELRTRSATRVKRKERWVVVDLYGDVLEEREPVVRSKRGRNQALPYRFRDSVVEPLKRATRSQRPSSTAHLTKRLLRSSHTT